LHVGIVISTVAFFSLIPIMFSLAKWLPGTGMAIALSITYSTSIVHVVYAFIWLKRRQLEPQPENDSALASALTNQSGS
jgi:hypothetical protein